MGIGTFGAFTQARLGIYAAQTGITVTGNNISNINTVGYTRQRLNQVSLYAAGSDRYYAEGDVRVGQGALVKSISQIRSPYLDIRYRDLNSKVGFYDGRLEGLDSIERILNEVGAGDVGKGEGGYGILGLDIMKVYTALENIKDQTGHQEYDDTVKGVASSLVNRLRSYANALEDTRTEYDIMLKQNLDQVNSYLSEIRTLNEQIRKSEIHGDPALELRDARNNAIDSLSELVAIDVTYSEEEIGAGVKVEKLSIRLGDANPDQEQEPKTDRSLLIDGVYGAQIILGKPAENPFYGREVPNDPAEFTALAKEVQDKFDLAAAPATEDELKPYVEFQYLKQETDKDGNVTKETPVSDIRNATIITDDAKNPNYDMMITELTNKAGDLNYEIETDVAQKVEPDDLPPALEWNWRTNKAPNVIENSPSKGDITIEIYTRTLQWDEHGNVKKDPDGKPVYLYSKQVHRQIISKPVVLDDNDLDGKIQAQREYLTEEGVFIDQNTIDNIDENAAGKRGIKYYQKALDLLANQLANVLNEANQGFLMDKNGNYVGDTGKVNEYGQAIGAPITITVNGVEEKINKDWDSMSKDVQDAILTGVGLTANTMKENGLTGKQVTDAYLKGQKWKADPDDNNTKKFMPVNQKVVDDQGNTVTEGWESPYKAIFVGGPLFSNANNSNDTTDITALNINISEMWQHNAMLVRGYECVDGTIEVASGQSDNLRHLAYLMSYAKHDFTPNQLASSPTATDKVLFNGTFFDMWNDIGGTLGLDQTEASTNLDNYYQNALSVDTDRDSVSSVDFNDEAMNLMMYSKSYNAACRLMTTIDSVLDKLINNTGMTT